MRSLMVGLALTCSLVASPALAGQERQVKDRDPDMVDAAKTPINDLNVGRDKEIPPLLIEAGAKPYSLEGLGKCRQLAAAINDLDTLLGPDIDLPQEERDRISGGRVAQWVVSSFIPFRGLIREISGANAQDRKVNAAVQAGLARRGFLKGVGAAKGCAYPASPAPRHVVKARLDELTKKDGKDEKAATQDAKVEKLASNDAAVAAPARKIEYTSQPVVQAVR